MKASRPTAGGLAWPDVVVLIAILLHIAASPYTKVEESFNMQAVHDLLYHGRATICYFPHFPK